MFVSSSAASRGVRLKGLWSWVATRSLQGGLQGGMRAAGIAPGLLAW